MHEIDTDGHVANQFDEGDPGVPRLPTVIDADWLNAVQNEIVNVVETGIALVKGTNTQLRSAVMNLFTDQSAAGVKTFTGRLIATAANLATDALLTVTSTASGRAAKFLSPTNNVSVVQVDQTSTGVGLEITKTGASDTNALLKLTANADTVFEKAVEVVKGIVKFSGANPADADAHTNILSALGLEKGWAHFAWSNGAPTLSSGMNMAAPGNPAAGQIQINMTAGIGTGAMVVTGIAGAASYIVVPKNLLGLIEIQDLTGTPVAFGSTTGFAFVRITGRQ